MFNIIEGGISLKLKQLRRNGSIILGIETEQGIVDVPIESARRGLKAPCTMMDVIRGGEDAMSILKALTVEPRCFTDATAAPAVTGCEKILCIGLNYRRHAQVRNLAIPEAPVLFSKYNNALAADYDRITLIERYREYDYEAELVAIIGKTAKNVSAEDALRYVFGYTCGNDLSTRDLQQKRGGQWVLSKSLDGFAPIGPSVVTANELDSNNLHISCTVNGELRQNSSTSDMIFSLSQIIEDVSRHMTLVPGDLIFTGSPEGVVQGYPVDKRQWLKAGDRLEVTIEGIGTLHNTLC